jgi:hypothetical protein
MVFLLLLLLAGAAGAQVYDQGGPLLRHTPDYESPQMHKGYGPRQLPETYARPWYYTDTDYSRQYYIRYINRQLEGREFFDTFGRSLGQGWQVYTWSQEQPGARGSLVDKKRRFAGVGAGGIGLNVYSGWFKNLVIAAEKGRQGAWALMVGDEISTYFTPLTFAKPRFNGVRLDWAGDRLSSTLVLSRPSQPDDQERTNATHLLGGRAQFQAGPRATFGLTYVNAHNVQTQEEFSEGNPLRGALTSHQNQPLEKLWVRVRDDSPGKGLEGARLAGHEIALTDTSGRQVRGRELGLAPRVSGGIAQDSRLVAQDGESILLEYDLGLLKDTGFNSGALAAAQVELALANDYRVEVASNLQTDGERFNPEIVFLPLARARGNVQDNTNTRVLRLDYGLPVGNELLGLDWNLVEWGGLSAQGELVLNRRYRRYPNPLRPTHRQSVDQDRAAYLQLAYQRQPLTFFWEGFAIGQGYSTAYWLADADGRLRYKNPIPQVYEFVDDDDDQDRRPEWQRPFVNTWSEVAWPGFDENQDFRNDYDQNANRIPDYEEPFLRWAADRPEFLFGMDLNHNGTADRFENDELPDYPYRADHRGFNTYVQLRPRPELRFLAGRQDFRLVAGDGRTASWYGLAACEAGRLRLLAHGARVRDEIPDPLVQWFQPRNAPGVMRQVRDLLPGRDAWKILLYGDLEQRLGPGLRLQHRAKWEHWRQQERDPDLRRNAGFAGLLDKLTWQLPLGLAFLEPRWKSEYRRERPFNRRLMVSASLEETAILLYTQPLLAERTQVGYFPGRGRQLLATELQLGVERSWFWLLEGTREEVAGDYSSWTWVGQFTNRSAYQGYLLITRLGLEVEARRLEGEAAPRHTQVFLSVNAGLR